jgi:cytochrome P450
MDPEELHRLQDAFSRYNANSNSITPAEALELFERGRGVCPVAHSSELGGFHLFLTYQDVRQGLLNWRTYSSSPSVTRPLTPGKPSFPPLEYDPPDHSEWREMFIEAVNAEAAKRIEPQIRADAVRIIERIRVNERCDLVADLAEIIPMNAICYILGVDAEHREKVRTLTLALLASVANPPEFERLFTEFGAFGCAEVEKRRLEPRADYLTTLGSARVGGRLLTPEEIGAATSSLLLAGHGTTVAAMTNLFYEVLSRPLIRKRLLDDPTLIPNAVDEVLRMHTPFFGLYRRATRAVSVRGKHIAAGESVFMCWQSANRDAAEFPDPNDFRLDREIGRHLAFGLGKHFCVGSIVAKLEMKIVLEELLSRLPGIRLIDADKLRFEFRGTETAAIPSLPARVDSAPC